MCKRIFIKPLITTFYPDFEKAAELLIQKRANVNVGAFDGVTALIQAVFKSTHASKILTSQIG